MPRLAEEILLLTLNNDGGDITPSVPPQSLHTLLAGALLMDLALEDRIDTDSERVILVDQTPVGDNLLDSVLVDIAAADEQRPVDYWLQRASTRGDEIREAALASLVQQGIVQSDESLMFFLTSRVLHSRRYPTIDGATTEEVRFRIMRLLFSDDIPDPRDIVLISLAAAGDVFKHLLSREELAEAQERIDLISRMDLIGRSVALALKPTEAPVSVPSVRPVMQIPEASGWPVLGSAISMAGDIRGFLTQEYRKHGPIFRVRALHHRFIALVGPEANAFLAKISGTHLRSYEPYREFGIALGAHRIMLNMDGPEHLRVRKLQVKGYSPKIFEANLDLVQDATRRMVAAWPQGRPIGIQRAMQELIAEQIGLCCTSTSPQTYIDDLIHFLETTIMVHIAGRSPKLVKSLPKFRRSERRVVELCQRILEAHQPEKRGDAEPDFVDDILEANRSDPQFLPETDLRANVIAPYLVGLDTSASVCAFMLYALLSHPEIWQRMQAEVDAMYEQGPPTPEALAKLDVTRRVALETLRFYPVIPVLQRIVSNSFDFMGYQVPAGAQILIGSTVGHHLEEYFPDPDVFDIERYAPGQAQHRQPGAFAPFGVGRHRCLGSSFAEVQIALTMATIVRETELTPERAERPPKIKQTPAPHLDASMRFRVTRHRREG